VACFRNQLLGIVSVCRHVVHVASVRITPGSRATRKLSTRTYNVHLADLMRQATPEVQFPEISPVKRAPRQKRPMPNRPEWMPTHGRNQAARCPVNPHDSRKHGTIGFAGLVKIAELLAAGGKWNDAHDECPDRRLRVSALHRVGPSGRNADTKSGQRRG